MPRSLPSCSLLALTLACGGEATAGSEGDTEPLPRRPPGLVAQAQLEQSTPSPHLGELVIGEEGLVYVANSNDSISTFRLVDDGGLEIVREHPTGELGQLRCTTLALDPGSRSLYCGSDVYLGIRRFDLSDPAWPQWDGSDFNPPLTGLRVSDLARLGDTLFMARFNEGLAWARVGQDGTLSELVELPEAGNVRKLDVDPGAGRLWALSVDRGLSVYELDVEQDSWTERTRLQLDGPALGLGVEGSRAALGLGSAGLGIVELDAQGELALRVELHPPGVVTAADLSGEVAAAITLTGAFVYDLREPSQWPEDPRGEVERSSQDEGGARLVGFSIAGPWTHPGGKGAMLDGRFVDGQDGASPTLVVSDWNWLERFAVDPEGFPSGIDVRRGIYAAGEQSTIAIALRNPTRLPQRVEIQILSEDSWETIELEPGEERVFELDAERLELGVADLVALRVFDGDELVAAPGVTVLRRADLPGHPVVQHGRPPPGADFPPLVLATGEPGMVEELAIPAGVEQRLVFYAIDCAAMWPEVEDLLWRVRSGQLPAQAVVLASHVDPSIEGARARWGLDDAPWGYFAPFAIPPEIAEQNPWEDLYEDGFVIYELPAAAHHPTDYLIDAEGIVQLVEREYRGEHELPH